MDYTMKLATSPEEKERLEKFVESISEDLLATFDYKQQNEILTAISERIRIKRAKDVEELSAQLKAATEVLNSTLEVSQPVMAAKCAID